MCKANWLVTVIVLLLTGMAASGRAEEAAGGLAAELDRTATHLLLMQDACSQLEKAAGAGQEKEFVTGCQRLIRNYVALVDNISEATRLGGKAEARLALARKTLAAVLEDNSHRGANHDQCLSARNDVMRELRGARDRFVAAPECERSAILVEIARLNRYADDFAAVSCLAVEASPLVISSTSKLKLADTCRQLEADLVHELQLLSVYERIASSRLAVLPKELEQIQLLMQTQQRLPTGEVAALQQTRHSLQELMKTICDAKEQLVPPDSGANGKQQPDVESTLRHADELLKRYPSPMTTSAAK